MSHAHSLCSSVPKSRDSRAVGVPCGMVIIEVLVYKPFEEANQLSTSCVDQRWVFECEFGSKVLANFVCTKPWKEMTLDPPPKYPRIRACELVRTLQLNLCLKSLQVELTGVEELKYVKQCLLL